MLHDFHISIACECRDPDQMLLNSLGPITISSVDADSNVGVWSVPEPTTAVLLSLGLAGLGFSRRKLLRQ